MVDTHVGVVAPLAAPIIDGLCPISPMPSAAAAGRDQAASEVIDDGLQLDEIDDLKAAVDSHEKAILEHALGKHRWNQRQTAKALGLSYDQLRHAIKKHGLTDSD